MSIPSHATKVFKGIAIDVYQWPQELFDGTIKIFESAVRTPSVQILAVTDGKILLNREQQPGRQAFISPIGGLIDAGETPLEAAMRELLEETGMVSDDWDVFSVHSSEGRFQVVTTNFIARECHKVADVHLDAGERIEVMALSLDEFFEYVKNDGFRNKNLAFDLLRILLDENKKEEFRRRLFSS